MCIFSSHQGGHQQHQLIRLGDCLPLNGSLVMQIFWRRFLVEDKKDPDGDLSTVLVRCAVLPSLVANLPCTLCRKHTLSIRAVNCTLGMVCGLETFCTSCDKVINATLSSDSIDGTYTFRNVYAKFHSSRLLFRC